jgi:hypothetical protein
MIYTKSQRDSRQWACKSRVAVCYGFRGEAGSLSLGGADYYNNVFRAVIISRRLYPLLIFQVHSSCCRSDKAFARREDNFKTGFLEAFLNSGSGYAVSVANDNYFLVIKQTHAKPPFSKNF